MSETKSIKLNSGNIINIRKSLCDKITKYWRTIRNENVMSNKAIKAKIGSGYDLKALYNEITQMAEKRIYITANIARRSICLFPKQLGDENRTCFEIVQDEGGIA